ncbi:MAG: hypothetical protein WB816_03720 [Methylocystis sp.]
MSDGVSLSQMIGTMSSGTIARDVETRESTISLERVITLDPASNALDALYQATFGEGARVVGVIGIESGAGATTCARALARRCALAYRRTLLVDLSGRFKTGGPDGTQLPLLKDGYEAMCIRPNDADLYQCRNKEFLKRLLTKTFAGYESIIVDCAPALARFDDAVPGRLTAGCVDTVLLVCRGDTATKQTIDRAKSILTRTPIRGVIVNGRDQRTLGEELAREAMRFSRAFPALAGRVARRLLRSRFLNVHT